MTFPQLQAKYKPPHLVAKKVIFLEKIATFPQNEELLSYEFSPFLDQNKQMDRNRLFHNIKAHNCHYLKFQKVNYLHFVSLEPLSYVLV